MNIGYKSYLVLVVGEVGESKALANPFQPDRIQLALVNPIDHPTSTTGSRIA